MQGEQAPAEQIEEGRARVGHEEAAVAGAAQQHRRVAARRALGSEPRERRPAAPRARAPRPSGTAPRLGSALPLRARAREQALHERRARRRRASPSTSRARSSSPRASDGLEERLRRGRARTRSKAVELARQLAPARVHVDAARRAAAPAGRPSAAPRAAARSAAARARAARGAPVLRSRGPTARTARAAAAAAWRGSPPRSASCAGPRARGRSRRRDPPSELPEHEHVGAQRGHGAALVPPTTEPLAGGIVDPLRRTRTLVGVPRRRRGDQRSHPDPERAIPDRARARLQRGPRGRADRGRRRLDRRHRRGGALPARRAGAPARRRAARADGRRLSRRRGARWCCSCTPTRASSRAGARRSSARSPTRRPPGGAFRLRFDEARLRHAGDRARRAPARAPRAACPTATRRCSCAARSSTGAGGIAPVPIFEDLDLVRLIKRSGRLALLLGAGVDLARAATSATACCASVLRNQAALAGYFLRLPRARIAAWYRRRPRGMSSRDRHARCRTSGHATATSGP